MNQSAPQHRSLTEEALAALAKPRGHQAAGGESGSETGEGRAGYRPEIDGLRAIAVIAVIIFHFNERLLPRGFLGVDIFFVISGYVITSSLSQLPSGSLGGFLRGFYARRIKRLVPALAVCVAVSSLLICLFNPQPGLSLKTGLTALFGLSNLYLLRASRDYFAQSAELNIFTNTWSLGVEEQFYLLFPLLFRLLATGRSGRWRWLFPGVMGGLSLLSLLLFIGMSSSNRAAAFFLMPARFWELGAGCLLFTWRERFAAWLVRIEPLVPLALLIGVLAVPVPSENRATMWATMASVVLTCLLIGSLTTGTLGVRLLTQRLVVQVGLISYSLYLWHWSVLAISRWTIGIDGWTSPVLILLMVLLAIGSYHLVERPLRHRRWATGEWGTIGLGLVLLGGIATLLIVFNNTGGRLYLGEPGGIGRNRMESAILASPEFADIATQAADWERRCNMTPHLLTGDSFQPRPVIDQGFVERCLAAPPGRRRLILVGDSFASVTAPHLAAIARRNGLEFRIIYGFGCPYPLPLGEIRDEPGLTCQEVDEELLRSTLIANLRPNDLFVLRLYLPRYIPLEQDRISPATAYDRALRRLREEVISKGASLLVIGANPTPTAAQIQALDRQWFNLRQSSSADLTEIGPLDNLETAYDLRIDDHLQRSLPAARSVFFSLRPWLCNRDNLCRLTDRGRPIYNYDPHLTPSAHDLFFDQLSTTVRELVGD
jgi:peptidoglycan/LPS O-acetylase OafA/YrhL